jgi:uracil-DNA glycosylase family 4
VNLGDQVRRHLAALKAAGVDYIAAVAQVSASGGRQPPVDPQVATTSSHLGADAPRAPEARPKPAAPVVVPSTLFGGVGTGLEVPTTSEGRTTALSVLAKEVAGCTRCPELAATRTQTVFGVGPLSPDVCFIGEGPGADEDRLGEPFVGKSGQLLNKIIEAMGMRRADAYIMNVVKCRPPNNRDPSPEESLNCRPYFDRQLELVKPKVIVCLGGTAAKHLLQITTGITKVRGTWREYAGTPVMCTFHPAGLLRNPEWKRDTWEDMKAVLAKLGRPVPGAR